jgi:6-phosphogluconolactonase
VADLGLDQVRIYRYGATSGSLTANDALTLAPGSGPRHIAFHPNGRFAYVINELDSTLTALNYDAERGRLTRRQSVPTTPRDAKGSNTTAEVQVHPSGRFVFGSNRGYDSVVTCRVDPATGELSPVASQSAGIKVPRYFTIDPSGNYLVVANQGSDSLAVFNIDPMTGILKPTGHTASVPTPVCIVFVAKT